MGQLLGEHSQTTSFDHARPPYALRTLKEAVEELCATDKEKTGEILVNAVTFSAKLGSGLPSANLVVVSEP